ncbi:MAG: type II secretion system protein GspN [Desulfovibrionales bacterium]
MNKYAVIAVYALVGLTSFLVFLLLLFPVSFLESRIENWAVSRNIPMQVNNLEYDFPTGMEFSELNLLNIRRTETLATLRPGRVDLQPLSLFSNRLNLSLQGATFGGSVQADLRAPLFTTTAYGVDLIASDLRFVDFPPSSWVRSMVVSGGADLQLNRPEARGTSAPWIGVLQLEDVEALLGNPAVQDIALDNLNGKIEFLIQNNVLTIEKSNFKGDALQGTITGRITLGPDQDRTMLALDLTLRVDTAKLGSPLSALLPKKAWRIRITGPLSTPRFTAT